jgi:C4-dicarboxylate-specific signal transduction histidine kinase
MSILANAQAAKRWLNAGPPNVTEVNSSIERIIRDARAADETMQHIRALFKQESFDKKDVNIPDVIREVVRIVQEDPKKRDVPIKCHFEESLPAVPVDQIQIQQLFINLIVNAIGTQRAMIFGHGALCLASSSTMSSDVDCPVGFSAAAPQCRSISLRP